MRDNVVKVDVLVAPLEVVNDALVCQLLLHDEDVLKEVDDSLIDIEVVELGNHCLLIFQVAFVSVNQGVPLVDHAANVVEHLSIHGAFQACYRIVQSLVLGVFPIQLRIHGLDLLIVTVQLAYDHLLVLSVLKLALDLLKVVHYLRQFVRVCLLRSCLVE